MALAFEVHLHRKAAIVTDAAGRRVLPDGFAPGRRSVLCRGCAIAGDRPMVPVDRLELEKTSRDCYKTHPWFTYLFDT